jgi:monovalent cation:H+ antiporter-2, CPA2 family
MQSVNLLRDLAMIMMVAGAAALVCHYTRLPKVVGYIAAGIFVGPHTPGWRLVSDQALISALADLGIVFLLFSLGLEFNLRRLRRVGAAAIVIGAVDFVVLTWCGYACGRILGWQPLPSLFLGAVISDSSTTVLAKLLAELGWSRSRFAALLFGATLVEDVLAIAMIAILTGLARGGVDAGALMDQFGVLWVFLVVVILAGTLLVPRLVALVVRTDPEELLLLVVLALCFGISLLAAHLGFSVALGAFVIGAVTAESRVSRRIELLIAPLRLMFGAVFFVAIGLMVNPAEMLANAGLIVLLVAILLVAKACGCFLTATAMGSDGRDAFRIALGMAQVCEFALIIGALGQSLGVTPPGLLSTAVGVCVISTLLNPLLLRRSEALLGLASRCVPSPLRRALRFYTHWLGHATQHDHGGTVRRLVLRCVWIVMINLACISGVYMLAAYASRRGDVSSLFIIRHWPGGNAAVYWLLATLVSLPFFLATAMKLRALGMILAELSLPFWGRLASGPHLCRLVASGFYFVGLAGVLLFAFALSATFMVSWAVLWQHVAIVVVVLALGWQRLLRLYGRAQIALQGHFARELPAPAPGSFAATVGALLDADMLALTLPQGSPLAGMTLREAQLRNRFGVTVASIERRGKVTPNPEAGTRLEPGDAVLLLGAPDALQRAADAIGAGRTE